MASSILDPIQAIRMDGRRIDLTRLHPHDVSLTEICRRLSYICRFAGGTARFYSVAAHSYNLAKYWMSETAMQPGNGRPKDLRTMIVALLHDAAEAFMGDMPSPIKSRLCPEYVRLEDAVHDRIYRALVPTDLRLESCDIASQHAALTTAEIELLKPEAVASAAFDLIPSDDMHEVAGLLYDVCRRLGVRSHG